MNENLKKFMEIISKDANLQKELKENTNSTLDELKDKIIDIAKRKGISLTSDDLDDKKLDVNELKKLTGAGCFIIGKVEEEGCYCVVIGAVDGCGCVGIGMSAM